MTKQERQRKLIDKAIQEIQQRISTSREGLVKFSTGYKANGLGGFSDKC
jgi:hypothetical protein